MTVSGGNNNRERPATAAILTFMQDPDINPFVRMPVGNSAMSEPSFRMYSPPTRPAISLSSFTTDTISLHHFSAHSAAHQSSAGLTFGTGTSYTSSASIMTPQEAPRQRMYALSGSLPLMNIKYECPFDRLNCLETFTEVKPWYDHSLTHFYHHDPPTKNSCCFCSETFDGTRSWKLRLDHVKLHHDGGEKLGTSRFDSELYRYLWSKRLLSNVYYKDLTEGAFSSSRY